MESPYKRPVAADLIGKVLDKQWDAASREFVVCGFSQEMQIYMALKEAGFLTESAQIPNDLPRYVPVPVPNYMCINGLPQDHDTSKCCNSTVNTLKGE